MSRLHTILVRPLETEKSVAQAGKFTFEVLRDACKTEIGQAVEKYYGVKVAAVRTIIVAPKTRSAGRRELVKRPLFKKAIVKTVGGAAIDFNKVNAA